LGYRSFCAPDRHETLLLNPFFQVCWFWACRPPWSLPVFCVAERCAELPLCPGLAGWRCGLPAVLGQRTNSWLPPPVSGVCNGSWAVAPLALAPCSIALLTLRRISRLFCWPHRSLLLGWVHIVWQVLPRITRAALPRVSTRAPVEEEHQAPTTDGLPLDEGEYPDYPAFGTSPPANWSARTLKADSHGGPDTPYTARWVFVGGRW